MPGTRTLRLDGGLYAIEAAGLIYDTRKAASGRYSRRFSWRRKAH